MKHSMFQELLQSVRQAGAIFRGEQPASREFSYPLFGRTCDGMSEQGCFVIGHDEKGHLKWMDWETLRHNLVIHTGDIDQKSSSDVFTKLAENFVATGKGFVFANPLGTTMDRFRLQAMAKLQSRELVTIKPSDSFDLLDAIKRQDLVYVTGWDHQSWDEQLGEWVRRRAEDILNSVAKPIPTGKDQYQPFGLIVNGYDRRKCFDVAHKTRVLSMLGQGRSVSLCGILGIQSMARLHQGHAGEADQLYSGFGHHLFLLGGDPKQTIDDIKDLATKKATSFSSLEMRPPKDLADYLSKGRDEALFCQARNGFLERIQWAQEENR